MRMSLVARCSRAQPEEVTRCLLPVGPSLAGKGFGVVCIASWVAGNPNKNFKKFQIIRFKKQNKTKKTSFGTIPVFTGKGRVGGPG